MLCKSREDKMIMEELHTMNEEKLEETLTLLQEIKKGLASSEVDATPQTQTKGE